MSIATRRLQYQLERAAANAAAAEQVATLSVPKPLVIPNPLVSPEQPGAKSEEQFAEELAQGHAVRSDDGSLLLYACPHCKATVSTEVTAVNCSIFRHGADPQTWQALGQHASATAASAAVEAWAKVGSVANGTGCGMQYRLIASAPHPYRVEACEGL